MEKGELRKSTRQQMIDFATLPANKREMEERLYQDLYASNIWQQAKVIGMTKSMPFELATMPVIEKGWQLDKTMAIPKTSNAGKMDFVEYTSSTELFLTKFGVEEPVNGRLIMPSEIDLLIVPGVVFSSSGYRIGFGGGYYDRYLAVFKGKTVALAFPFQLSDDWQPNQYDQPVDRLFTIQT